MNNRFYYVTVLAVILISSCFNLSIAHARTQKLEEAFNPVAAAKFVDEAAPPTEPLTLWYRKPARKWENEALPVGNGRMGAMVFGGVDRERIQFNEETVWDGEYIDRHRPDAVSYTHLTLPTIYSV